MNISEVTRKNLKNAVNYALQICEQQMNALAKHEQHSNIARDLTIARQSLSIIASEMNTGSGRSRGDRAGLFTRYTIDEGPRMSMDETLRDLIVKIEYIYKKW